MTYGSLCTGVGGLDLAVEDVFGVRMAWYSEIDIPVSVHSSNARKVARTGRVERIWSNRDLDLALGAMP